MTSRRSAPVVAVVALHVAIFLAVLFALHAAADEATPDSACPALSARMVIHDYDGPIVADFCVDPDGFRYTGATVTVVGGDPYSDGIFRGGFEDRP